MGAKPEPRQMEAPAFQNSTARRRQNPIRNRLARPSDTPPKGAIPSKTVSPRSATRPISATSNWCHPSSCDGEFQPVNLPVQSVPPGSSERLKSMSGCRLCGLLVTGFGESATGICSFRRTTPFPLERSGSAASVGAQAVKNCQSQTKLSFWGNGRREDSQTVTDKAFATNLRFMTRSSSNALLEVPEPRTARCAGWLGEGAE